MDTNDRGNIGRALYAVFSKFREHPFRVRESLRIGGEGSEPVLLQTRVSNSNSPRTGSGEPAYLEVNIDMQSIQRDADAAVLINDGVEILNLLIPIT